MKKDLAIGLKNNLHQVLEGFEKDFEDKVRNFLKGLTDNQVKDMLGKDKYTIRANGGDSCNILRFIDDFEAVEILPDYETNEHHAIILRFDELDTIQLMTLVDIAVLTMK